MATTQKILICWGVASTFLHSVLKALGVLSRPRTPEYSASCFWDAGLTLVPLPGGLGLSGEMLTAGVCPAEGGPANKGRAGRGPGRGGWDGSVCLHSLQPHPRSPEHVEESPPPRPAGSPGWGQQLREGGGLSTVTRHEAPLRSCHHLRGHPPLTCFTAELTCGDYCRTWGLPGREKSPVPTSLSFCFLTAAWEGTSFHRAVVRLDLRFPSCLGCLTPHVLSCPSPKLTTSCSPFHVWSSSSETPRTLVFLQRFLPCPTAAPVDRPPHTHIQADGLPAPSPP